MVTHCYDKAGLIGENKHRKQKCENKCKNRTLFQVVECTFGQLAERWRRLKYVHLRSMEDIVSVCLAACTLHTFCKLNNEEPFALADGIETPDEEDIVAADVTPDYLQSGRDRRQAILQLF